MYLSTTADFNAQQWAKIRADAYAWWAGELRRPLLQIRLRNAPATRPPSKLSFHPFQSFYDLSVPAEEIIDAWDYELSRIRYVGDAFPHAFINFGPGVIAAFLGCVLENGSGTTWFHPECELGLADIKLGYDKANVWFNRVKAVMAAAIERWQGAVQVGMTDLGGNLDILSTFRPNENLLFDLYDDPGTVKRLTWQAHELWWQYYNELSVAIQKANPGYTAWSPIFSEVPYYMLQSDFSYMIGPEMFDEFVKPELTASCKRLGNAFYHLDGKGQLVHIDSLLSIPELKGIQWIPGEGSPGQQHWPQVYRKIHESGKLIQIYDGDGLNVLNTIAQQIGTAKGIVLIADVDISQSSKVAAFLDQWYR